MRFIALMLVATFALQPAEKLDYLVYVGTFTGAKSKGIYSYRFQPYTGKLTSLGLAAETASPSFLAIHPNGRFLYTVNEVNAGSVTGFLIDGVSGKLTPINTVSSRGAGPCHLSLDRTGKCLLVANYGSGSVASYPIAAEGRLGDAASFIQHVGSSADRSRQRGPHAHFILPSPDNRFALVADLGLDKIFAYRFDAARFALSDPAITNVKPGSGPRHLVFSRDGQFAWVINELQSTITGFRYDAKTGSLTERQTVSTLPDGFSGKNSTAEIALDSSGRFLYGSNRGEDSIVVFAADANSGSLTFVERVSTEGKTPRNFAIDPTGAYLLAANQDADSIVVFRIDRPTGRLTPTGETVDAPSPVSIAFVP